MKTIQSLLCSALALLLLVGCSESAVLKTRVPARPAGQEDVIELAVAPMDTVRIGMVGLGMRGNHAVKRLCQIPGAKITALCDLRESVVVECQEMMAGFGKEPAKTYFGSEDSWKALCEQEDIDLVYICTDWLTHTPIALHAMDHGKHVAIEVPAALDMDQIWALIDKAEQKRLHCMMLENCVYDFFELSTLQMAQDGAFGELIHAEGAYHHNLDAFWGGYWNNWRLEYNSKFRGDNYPTHGIGPICQALNIHRGDRMTRLVSMDTKPFNGPKLMEHYSGEPCPEFAQGDETNTLIQTANGRTMLIQHDVMTPRPYDRLYQLVGTEGYAGKYPSKIYCFHEVIEEKVDAAHIADEKSYTGAELKAIQEQHRPAILTEELETLAKKVGGHGGMDFIMDYRLVYCLRNGLPLDMDVYDLAEWCCLAPLSRLSLENDNRPVEIPDFTRGAWKKAQAYKHYLK
ncbi:MAG: Gfo/Idh/MocA family oxidoreductase [Bacteroidales bacterium]|nr:Gfo/Idh/MocA family oxidoreductase [Bacteroidales bacterium]